MKKWINFIMGFVLIAAASICSTSCDRVRQTDEQAFEAMLEEHLPKALQNVYTFSDVNDVILYKHERVSQLFTDSVFTSLSDQEIANVVSVLKKQQDTFGVSDIVYEYRANQRIYSNLPDANTSSPTTTEQPDPPVAAKQGDSIVEFSSLNP